MANQYFECIKCGYTEAKLAPSHVTVAQEPCSKCGGKMVRKS